MRQVASLSLAIFGLEVVAMLAKALTCAVVGLEGVIVEVEVDSHPGLPRIDIVGLPDAAVQEARERVRAAIRNSGCMFPGGKRITVNLAPGDLKKEGPDLPTGHQLTCGERHRGWARPGCGMEVRMKTTIR
jgi:hypothetical protein